MAKNDESPEQEPLTEEQRISALEDKVGTNKIVLIGMTIFLIIGVSVATTFLIVSLLDKGDPAVESDIVVAMQERVTELEKNIEDMKKTVKASRSDLLILKEKVENSSNLKLQQILLEQERGHQTFLDTLKSGMYDIAHMIPGSRTWLEVYGEKVDKAEMLSKDREKALLKLQKGTMSEKETTDDPFSEGF